MTDKIHDQMSQYLDATLVNVLMNGRPALGPDGQVQLDSEGNVKTIPASASDMNIARQRLRDLGIEKVPQSNIDPKEIAEELRAQDARIDNFNLPQMADGDDAATGE